MVPFSDSLEDYVQFDRPGVSSNTDVFETFMVMDNGHVFMLDEHLDRMKRSICELELGEEPDTKHLCRQIESLAEKDEFRNRVLRLEYSADTGGAPRFSVNVRDCSKTPGSQNSLRLVITDVRRNPKSYIVYHKTGNYLENKIAQRKAKKQGFDDALFLNTDGFIAETTASNIFLVKEKTLLTPSIDTGILPGIVRSWVINQAIRHDLITLQMFLDAGELREAEEVFVTNSVIGICPVSEVFDGSGVVFSSSGEMPVTATLQKAFDDALRSSDGREPR
ncbi:MAG: aminotransferase class IV [Clostridiales bacterium]|nr:aminotransferase class IV [Clostridiales bacterium]